MISIYRVENESNQGLYHPKSPFKLCGYNGGKADRHPCPLEDSSTYSWWRANEANRRYKSDTVGWGEPRLIFGFTSIQQMKMWIYSGITRHELNQHGYTLNHYVAHEALLNQETDYVLGDTQAIFKHKSFELFEILNLTEV